MPGQPPPEPDDRTVLYALPEDQPDGLSQGQKSKQADLDETPAQKAGTPDNGSAGEDPIVTNGSEEQPEPVKAAPRKATRK